MRLIAACLAIALTMSPAAQAGPYFNPPADSSEETRNALNSIERILNQARKFVIDLLDQWESDPGQADDNAKQAAELLRSAQENLAEFTLPEGEDFNLDYEPDSELARSVLLQFEALVSQFPGVERPRSYSELLNASAAVIGAYASALEELSPDDIRDPGAIWRNAREVLRADNLVTLFGSGASLLANPEYTQ
ncbi:hypothetical protein [Leisingera caerulea]|uniref:hypothetical protein n=1 Tax=Leisingera caerulea TaxID=506591 RepID=UPI00040FB6BC|nr:hypothetical protein [Leisingera caerulea]